MILTSSMLTELVFISLHLATSSSFFPRSLRNKLYASVPWSIDDVEEVSLNRRCSKMPHRRLVSGSNIQFPTSRVNRNEAMSSLESSLTPVLTTTWKPCWSSGDTPRIGNCRGIQGQTQRRLAKKHRKRASMWKPFPSARPT